ncbi:GAP1-N1 domain-containing protein [Klebsiella pneumoniae]|uniref:GAP1-N1 domain-containing protein n=1 Tax=Klebsiella pneumoniae TaxID=573 RepID=UPI001CA48EA1|nr:hypothetical protein [Klebsiella pneumoniae]MBW5722773.1 hypothetical protein [Klebsiella pneumoniae]
MKLDHCLFGYDDGHRLIASSLPLGDEIAYLTELSDLAPGVIFGSSKGYWTGLPAPTIGRYVLMFTWPAPEMPRPGCVWTHALLLEPSMLESIKDLSILQGVISRPGNFVNKDYYSQPLEVDLTRKKITQLPLDLLLVEKLIDSLYGKVKTSIEVSSSDLLDRPLFAVWSQQWPRLRRNFRFQTAVSRKPRSTGSARFDIIAVFSQEDFFDSEIKDISSSWLNDAVVDIQSEMQHSFRNFLWEYGRDVRKQRGSFKPLAEIYSLSYETNTESILRIIEIVAEAFPTLNDANHLKQDLVDGGFAGQGQITLLNNLILSFEEEGAVFPPITTAGFDNLTGFWPRQSESVLNLLDLASQSKSESGEVIFKHLIRTVQTSEFWTLSRSNLIVRKLVVKQNPEFLLANESILDDSDIMDLLHLIPNDTKGLEQFINDMIERNNNDIASSIFDNFPDIAVAKVVQKLNSKKPVPTVWRKELWSRHDYLLKDEVIRNVTRASLLYDFADAFGWLSNVVIAEGLEPWYNSFMTVTNDLDGAALDMLDCFSIVLAIKSGGDKGLKIIEKNYSNLHRKILKSRLSPQARDMLFSQLPEIGWLRGWDLGYRFRLAIAQAYIYNKWSVNSFVSLASDRKGRELLADAASDIDGGREYSNAAWCD